MKEQIMSQQQRKLYCMKELEGIVEKIVDKKLEEKMPVLLEDYFRRKGIKLDEFKEGKTMKVVA